MDAQSNLSIDPTGEPLKLANGDRARRDAEVQRLLDLYLCATWTAREYQSAVDGGRRDVAARLATRMSEDQRAFEVRLRQVLRANP